MTHVKKPIGPHNTFRPFPDEDVEKSVPQVFAQAVSRYPDRLAVKAGRHTISYRELDDASNRIAQAILARRGAGAEAVALLLDHGLAPVTAILGVLKTGKFYVALDPTNAPSRLSYILKDTQSEIIVTDRRNYSLATELSRKKCQLLNVDHLQSSQSQNAPNISISPDSIAAVFYTSGSTGQPKGVIHAHRNFLYPVKISTNFRHMCMNDRVAQLFSWSFSWSKTNMFAPLLNGGMVFPFDLKSKGLEKLAGWLIREEITICDFVATAFRNFIATLTRDEEFPKLRILAIGGETVHRRDIELYREHFSHNCLLQLSMGITETCSRITSAFIDRTTEIQGDIMPAGYSTDGTEIMLLDEGGAEVDSGQVGEIVVKSRYLSPGYWNKPEMTAQTFLPIPGEEGLRMYRTGDLGRMSSDGCLYHLGRKDFQVKVRGHRVETTEVERALVTIEGISHAAVVAHPDPHGENRLAAYMVCRPPFKPTITRLRSLLKEKLPEYMMPSIFMFLDDLPKTTSGKIDIKDLPNPDASRPVLDTQYVAPRTTVEKKLAHIWSGILNVSPVGVGDDFFDLGGHSLSAAQLFSRIEKDFRKKLPLSILFKAPTVEKLAAVLSEKDESESWPIIVPIQSQGSKLPFFCIHDLSGDVVGYAELARNLGSDQPFYGLRAQGLDGKRKPLTRIETMASRYVTEMRSVQPEGPYVLGGMCLGGVVAFEMARQLHTQGQEIRLLVLLDSPCPPFTLQSHVLFQVKRYSWHIRENISGLVRRIYGRAPVPGRLSFIQRLFIFRTTIRKLRVDRANQRALQKYRPQPYPGSIVIFLVNQPLTKYSHGLRMRWKNYAGNGIEVHTIPGNHHTLLREPHVQLLAEKLNEYLSVVQSGHSNSVTVFHK